MKSFCANRAYIAFWADFFLQDHVSFLRTDLFLHEKHCCVIVFVDLFFQMAAYEVNISKVGFRHDANLNSYF